MLNKTNLDKIYPEVGFLDLERKKALEKILGVRIKTIGLFEQALTHRSYLQVRGDVNFESNERLEFLGDSILNFIVAEYLFSSNRKSKEGRLSKERSWLVRKSSLAKCCLELGLEEFLFISLAAKKTIKNGSETIISDLIEAIIAAIYLDSGYKMARDFVVERLLKIMRNEDLAQDTNFKSKLLEVVQKQSKEYPRYDVLEESGPDHLKKFRIGVFISEKLVAEAEGKSKKIAEQNAARIAFEKIESEMKQ